MEELKKLQQSQERKSEVVVELAQKHWSSIAASGNDKWGYLEQIYLACLDVPSASDLQQKCIGALSKQFPDSQRVQRLKAMGLEADGRYQDALDIYNEMLESDPLNPAVLKRKIAVYVGRNDTQLAITNLNKYLELYASDTEAWQQLAELYLQAQNYQGACFCLEELILTNPHNHVFYCTYAEILYTRGGSERLTQARRYFAKALELNPTSVRALYGLHLAAARTTSKGSSSKASEDVATVADLRNKSKVQILKQYEQHGACKQHTALVEATLHGL